MTDAVISTWRGGADVQLRIIFGQQLLFFQCCQFGLTIHRTTRCFRASTCAARCYRSDIYASILVEPHTQDAPYTSYIPVLQFWRFPRRRDFLPYSFQCSNNSVDGTLFYSMLSLFINFFLISGHRPFVYFDSNRQLKPKRMDLRILSPILVWLLGILHRIVISGHRPFVYFDSNRLLEYA